MIGGKEGDSGKQLWRQQKNVQDTLRKHYATPSFARDNDTLLAAMTITEGTYSIPSQGRNTLINIIQHPTYSFMGILRADRGQDGMTSLTVKRSEDGKNPDKTYFFAAMDPNHVIDGQSRRLSFESYNGFDTFSFIDIPEDTSTVVQSKGIYTGTKGKLHKVEMVVTLSGGTVIIDVMKEKTPNGDEQFVHIFADASNGMLLNKQTSPNNSFLYLPDEVIYKVSEDDTNRTTITVRYKDKEGIRKEHIFSYAPVVSIDAYRKHFESRIMLDEDHTPVLPIPDISQQEEDE